jgi:predicted MFS family arabinose efflux permease
MTAVLAQLRRRPWLIPCFVIAAIGGITMASNRLGSMLFWLGAVLIVLGLLAVVFAERADKRKQSA